METFRDYKGPAAHAATAHLEMLMVQTVSARTEARI